MRKILIIGGRWCKYCEELYSKAKERYRGEEIKFIDVDRFPHIADRFRFKSYPTLAILEGGLKLLEPIEDLDDIEIYLKNYVDSEVPKGLIKCVMRKGGYRLDSSLISSIISRVERKFDWTYGGLNTEYKFIPFNTLEFLIRMYLVRGVDGYLKMVHKTIDIILQSSIFNYKRNMVSRMAFTYDWEEPDNVYLIEDQARFVRLLIWLYQLTGNKIYLDIGSAITKSIFKNFINPGWIRAYIDEKTIKKSPPHIIHKVISYLTDSSISMDIRRYTVNLPRYVMNIDDVIVDRGYTYLGDLTSYIEANLSLYMMFRWRKGIGNIRNALNRIDSLRYDTLYRDIDRSILEGIDNWVCIPREQNLELMRSLLMLRNLKHIEFRNDPVKMIEGFPFIEEKDPEYISKAGLVLSLYIDGIDYIKISGYKDIPYNILQTLKPYVGIIFEDGERYIEYISKEYRFRL